MTRTCLGCHVKKNKGNFFRIANLSKKDTAKKVEKNNVENNIDNKQKELTNKIVLDRDQNLGGRGAYICSSTCFEKAVLKNFLQRRLKTNISQKQIEELKKAIDDRAMGGK